MCVYTAVPPSVPEVEDVRRWGSSFFKDVPWDEFMYPVLTCMSGGVTMGDSGLSCCFPCLLSTIVFDSRQSNFTRHIRWLGSSQYSFRFKISRYILGSTAF